MNKQDCSELAGDGVLRAQGAALELFQIAALMMGNEEQAVALVEEVLATVEADPCADTGVAHEEARLRLIGTAIRQLARQDPQAFSVPPAPEGVETCIDTDDLGAAGITSEQLTALIQGSERAQMREWLEHLSPALRAVFVLRAVVGQDAEKTAESLRRSGVAGAENWQREQVGATYRQALCSLASSLVSLRPVGVPV